MPTDLLVLLSPKNIIIFVLILSRLSGMMLSAPLFSTYPIPNQIKVWFLVFIAFLLFPIVSSKLSLNLPYGMPELLVFIFKEFAIGYIIGFLANLIFISLQIGAETLSVQIGFSASNVLDPTTQTTQPVLNQLYAIPAALLFLAINAHHLLFIAIAGSFKKIPLGFETFLQGDMVAQILKISSNMFEVALGLIFPVFGVLFVLEVLLGFVSKVMPQMNVFMVALPLKIYVGLFLILLFLAPTIDVMSTLIQSHMLQILKIFAGG